jgi:predicted class III extradiol MEMO1 family dioxygenase
MVKTKDKYYIKKAKHGSSDGYYSYKNGKKITFANGEPIFSLTTRSAKDVIARHKRLEYSTTKNRMKQKVIPVKTQNRSFFLRYKKKKSKIGFENQFSEWE